MAMEGEEHLRKTVKLTTKKMTMKLKTPTTKTISTCLY